VGRRVRILAADHDPEVRRHLPLLIGGRFASNLLLRYPAPFLGVIAAGFGTSVGTMGVALSAGEFAGLAAPAVGRAADRRGARTAMSVGLALVTVGALLAAAAPVVVVFAMAMVVVQLSKVSFDAATTTWVADRVPFGRRAEVTGLVETSWALALLVGIPVLGVVVGKVGWRWGYVVIAVLCGLAALGVRRRIPPSSGSRAGQLHPDALLDEAVGGPVGPTATAAVADAPVAEPDRPWWRLPGRTVLTLASVALLMGAVQLVVVVEGVWLEDVFGFSTAGIGVAIFFIGVAELVGSLGASRLTDRVGKRRSMVLGAVVMAPAMASLGLVGPHAAVGIAVVAVGTLGFEYALVSAFPLVAELDPAARGTMFTLMLAGGTAMRGVANAVGALLYEAGGIEVVGLASASVVVVVIGLLVVAVREPGKA
jgi:DHA1 family inner membrane transport protein